MWFHPGKVQTVVFLMILHGVFGQSALNRQRRVIAYPLNSCTGILVAMSLPLGLEHHNIFYSFNFEANYNMPTTAPDLIPGPLKRLELIDKRAFHEEHNGTSADQGSYVSPLISRVKLYKLIEQKMSGFNLNGRKCLLRLICEATAARASLFEHNGILGDLVRILLTPSSTSPEPDGPNIYLKSEVAGRGGNCGSYRKDCPVNFLDLFTSVM